MIRIENAPIKRTSAVDSFTRQFRNAAQEMGLQH
jgi:hypothetical protein